MKINKMIIKFIVFIMIFTSSVGTLNEISFAENEEKLSPQVLLSITEDAKTTQTFTWRAKGDITSSSIKFIEENAQEKQADLIKLNDEVNVFETTIRNLKPGTRYKYRVGQANNWSEELSFETQGHSDDFSFMYMGDVQSEYDKWGQLVDGAYSKNPHIKFGLMGGDMVDVGDDYSHWEDFLNNATPTFSSIPMMTTIGNHELYHYENNKADIYLKSLAMPKNGPKGFEEEFYSFDYGNSHFLVLDSNYMGRTTESKEEQQIIKDWIEKDLKANKGKWIFSVFHHPPYTVAPDRNAKTIRDNWIPLLEQGGVDVVLCGHQHVYMRTKPIKNNAIEENGIVYVMGNAGTKFYNGGNEYDYIDKEVAYKSNYQIVDVSSNKISLKSYDKDGKILDSWSKAGNKNTIEKHLKRHIDYMNREENTSKESNYAKGDYIASPLKITGSGLEEEQVFSLEELEKLGQDKSLNLEFEGEYSHMSSGSAWSNSENLGIKLYEFLTHVCKMDKNIDENTNISIVAVDGYTYNTQLSDIKKKYKSYEKQGDSEAINTDLPVLLGYSKNGKPLVGAVGSDENSYKPTDLEGYDEHADNSGGPIRLIVGQENNNDRNANKNVRNVREIIIGDKIKYSGHDYGPYKEFLDKTLTVNIYKDQEKIKTKLISLRELEAFANQNKSSVRGNYYGDLEDYYEGLDLWSLLNNYIGLSSSEATVVIGEERLDLNYFKNFNANKSKYNSNKLGIKTTGVMPIITSSKNGYPLVENKTDKGYVAVNKAGQRVENAGGTFTFALASNLANGLLESKVIATDSLDIYLDNSEDIHQGDMANKILSISGDGVKNSKEYKVSELEKKYDSFETVKIGIDSYRGLKLKSLLNDQQIGLNVDASEIIFKNDKNQLDIGLGELDNKILAFSKNNKALTSEEGGPLYLISDKLLLENINKIEVKRREGIWTHDTGVYKQYLDNRIEIRGSDLKYPVSLTLREIEAMELDAVRDSFYSGGDSNGGYEGIKLKSILKRVGVENPSKIVAIGKDGWQTELPIEDVLNGVESRYQEGQHRDVILAYAKDGYPLVASRDSEGYESSVGNGTGPMRIIVENTISLWNQNVVALILGNDYEDFESKVKSTEVSEDKEWKIKFNRKVDIDKVKGSVFVLDKLTKEKVILNLELSLDDLEQKTVILKHLKNESYELGKEYTLYVNENLKDIDENNLKNGVKLDFKIVK